MISRAASIWQKINHFRRSQNLPWPSLIKHIFSWYFVEKLSLDEMLVSGAYLLKHSDDDKYRRYPRRIIEPFLREQNSRDPQLIGDKAIFSQFIKCTDVLVPETLAIFDPREGIGITGTQDFILEKDAWLNRFMEKFPDKFIVKPANGLGGESIDIYKRQHDGQFLCQDGMFSAEEIYGRIVREQRYGKCVIQEVAKNHPAIDDFTGSFALQCLRLLTVRSRTDGIKVFSCEFRIAGSPDQDTDNFKRGLTGNILCKVNVANGEIYDAVALDIDKLEYNKVTHVPLTNAPIIGYTIPLFQEAIASTCHAHRSVWGQTYVGWDVAISDRGPMVIEGNSLWGGSSLTTPWFNYEDFELMTEMAE